MLAVKTFSAGYIRNNKKLTSRFLANTFPAEFIAGVITFAINQKHDIILPYRTGFTKR
ncbi:hypothetical protein [Candidatus Pantoea persica]|uniref:hypothetical protein n=1 Tax=Candidatus Pantoea persica TaxID=2518128 RepID=UPI00215DB975|nr:hypothetical protein [Candidatus Pantoea persica]MBA2815755.1 hypothetical protein [Candidatus Pantoea persica]